MREPSRLITARPWSVATATALPSPVQRVPNGRDVFGGNVVSDRASEPSRFAAQSTKAPDGLCRQYASRPVDESCGAPFLALGPEAGSAPASTVVKTSAIDPAAMTAAVAAYGRSPLAGRTSSIIAECRIPS